MCAELKRVISAELGIFLGKLGAEKEIGSVSSGLRRDLSLWEAVHHVWIIQKLREISLERHISVGNQDTLLLEI